MFLRIDLLQPEVPMPDEPNPNVPLRSRMLGSEGVRTLGV